MTTTCTTTQDASAVDRRSAVQARFEQLWNASGAVPLRGYEKVLVAMLAAEGPLYAQLASIDINDPISVEAGAEAIRQWRLTVATANVGGSDAFPRTSAIQARAASDSSSAACAGPDLLRKTA